MDNINQEQDISNEGTRMHPQNLPEPSAAMPQTDSQPSSSEQPGSTASPQPPRTQQQVEHATNVNDISNTPTVATNVGSVVNVNANIVLPPNITAWSSQPLPPQQQSTYFTPNIIYNFMNAPANTPQPPQAPRIPTSAGRPFIPENIPGNSTFPSAMGSVNFGSLSPHQPGSDQPIWPDIPPGWWRLGAQNALPYWRAGTFPAKPMSESLPIVIHPHLCLNPAQPYTPKLNWDMMYHPLSMYHSAKLYTAREGFMSPQLSDDAVFPEAKEIHIVGDCLMAGHLSVYYWMQLWGPIVIQKNDSITVEDVLEAIYHYFREPLTNNDLELLGRNTENERRLRYYLRMRARYGEDNRGYVFGSSNWRNYGCPRFLRIDALGGMRQLQGLRPVLFADQTWKMFLSVLPAQEPPEIFC